MGRKEIERHVKILRDAFVNYSDDTRRWIGREITQGVIKGESIPKIARRINNTALMHSKNSAMLIARTETLRSTGLGSQIAYDKAADLGVKVRQIWDATLDEKTRVSHAALDGQARDDKTGMFSTSVGQIPGPRRSGVAGFDINCRCAVRPEVEGFSPEVRRIRGEGLQPYQTFKTWGDRRGVLKNVYGEKYNFLD